MNPWETITEKDDKDISDGEKKIAEIDLNICNMIDSTKHAIDKIEGEISTIKRFIEKIELSSDNFTESFISNIEVIENSFKTIIKLKNNFEELEKVLGKNNAENNDAVIGPNEIKKDTKKEIKEEMEDAIDSILIAIPHFEESLDTIECLPEDFTKNFIETVIREIKNIEKGIERLRHCKETISKFY